MKMLATLRSHPGTRDCDSDAAGGLHGRKLPSAFGVSSKPAVAWWPRRRRGRTSLATLAEGQTATIAVPTSGDDSWMSVYVGYLSSSVISGEGPVGLSVVMVSSVGTATGLAGSDTPDRLSLAILS